MELDAPRTGICPICESQQVTFNLNSGGKPYFTCHGLCQTTVNMHGIDEDEKVDTVLARYFDESESKDLNESDPDPEETNDEPQSESRSVADLFDGESK